MPTEGLHVNFSINATEAAVYLDGQEIHWSTEAAHPFSATNGNFALLASLPTAFTQGRSLHIAGSVDRSLLRNAVLLSHFWAQWRPARYSAIEITADRLSDDKSSEGKNAICLSGGVDSTFALLSSLNERPPMQFDVGLGIFVQGFDFSLSDTDGYDRTLEAIRRVARPREIPVASVRTNWKGAVCGPDKASWEHVHTVGLASILHLFEGVHAGGILASDYTYAEDHAVAPWSSNATTNRMLGGATFPIVPVGEHATRIDKIAAIANWDELSNVMVCWAGPRTGSNCSKCEKCVRTMLMCEARGIDPTPAFGRRPVPADLKHLSLHSSGKIAFMRQTLGRESKLPPELKSAVERAIRRNSIRNWLKPHRGKLREFRRSLLRNS